MKTSYCKHLLILFQILLLLFAFPSLSQPPVSWTNYINSSRPNSLGLDATTGTKSIAYSPLNYDVYVIGQIYYGLPAVPSGLAWGREIGITRYNHSTGAVVNSYIDNHHSIADTIPFFDSPGELVIANDGSIYSTVKFYYSGVYSYDMKVTKYSPDLVPLWTHYFYGPGASIDAGIAITLDGSGNICVAGQIGDNGTGTGSDFLIAKLDPSGNLLWSTVFNWNSSNNDTPTDITTDNKGNVYVAGYTHSAGSGDQYAVIKYSGLGIFQWKKAYNGTSGTAADKANSIAVDNASRKVVVTGTSTNAAGNTDIATLCYDSLGNVLWTKRINTSGTSNDHGYKVVINSSHRIFVGGDVDRDTSAVTSGDLIIRKYDMNGNVLRTSKYNGGSYKCAFGDLAVANSGSIYITGTCDGAVPPPGHGNSLVTIKYNSSGTLQWVDLLSPAQFQTCGEGYYGWGLAVQESTSEIAVGGRHFVDCPGANTEELLTRRYSITARMDQEQINPISEEGISLFPVPATEILHVKINEEIAGNLQVNIYSMQGQLWKSFTCIPGENEISIVELPAGIYFLQATDGTKNYRKKFIRE